MNNKIQHLQNEIHQLQATAHDMKLIVFFGLVALVCLTVLELCEGPR